MRKKLLLLLAGLLSVNIFGSNDSDSMFPLFKDEVIKRGYKLPKPYGVNLIYVDMKQNVDINQISLSKLKFLNIDIKDAEASNVTKGARVDLWLFPFMNIYGMVGETKGKSKAKIDISLKKIPGLKVKDVDFALEYDGITYGGGTILAGGYKNIFAMTDINYTRTTLDILEGDITALTVSPRVGYNFPGEKAQTSIWIGGMYQEISQTLKGNIADVIPINIPGKFEVKEKAKNPWNYVIGTRTEFSNNIEITAELGLGQRKSILLGLGYRF
ncbi:MAG: hypothetical protein ACRC1R_03260 [Cetobacterium sp.]|uniref:hypothetical protein n=1 Tax=Cetobacterium sp. TaxID=2071632 RepID=UPI003F3B6272